jgi:hypothetical protein
MFVGLTWWPGRVGLWFLILTFAWVWP